MQEFVKSLEVPPPSSASYITTHTTANPPMLTRWVNRNLNYHLSYSHSQLCFGNEWQICFISSMIDNEFIHINEVVVVKNSRGESSYFCPHFKMQTSCERGMNSPNHVLFNAADTRFTYVSKNVPHCDGWMTELLLLN